MSGTQVATFAVALQDRISGPAATAGVALRDLRTKIDTDTRALRDMTAAMGRLRAGGLGGSETFKTLRARATALRAELAQSTEQVAQLGGAFGKIDAAASATSGGVGDLVTSLQRAPGPIGQIAGRLQGIGALVSGGGAIAAGLLAVAAAMVAVTAAAISGAAALVRYGIAAADARRAEALRLEGLTTIRRWHGLAAGSAAELQVAIDRVSDSSALGRSEVSGYAEQLYRMGLRGADLSDALEGATIAAAVQGDAFGRRFAGMAAAAVRTGGSVRRLADDVRARLGGVALRMAAGLDRQMSRLRENVAHLFEGLEIEGLLRGLRDVTSLFSQSTAGGRALRTMITALFQPIIGQLEAAGPMVRRFFQGMVIAALRFTIVVLTVRNAIRDAFGDSELFSGLDGAQIALNAGIAVFSLFAGAVTIAAVATGALVAGLALVATSLAVLSAPIVAPILAAAAGMYALLAAGRRFVTWFRGIDWSALGTSLVQGLVRGLERGRELIVESVRGVAETATSALTEALGIRSPSRVFAELGRQIPAGFAVGVEGAAPRASAAVEETIGAAPAALGSGGRAPSAPSAAPVTLTIGELHVHAGAGESTARAFVDELAEILAGVSVRMGAA